MRGSWTGMPIKASIPLTNKHCTKWRKIPKPSEFPPPPN